ncbi:MAG TPA: MFS transporter [Candidatus Acidoferrales bacterium]|nr:MFS transporter [Candidatus Acidoferrales bacterium]
MRSLSAGIIVLVFPYYILQSLRYSALDLGLLYTAATLATAGFALLFGFLTDLWGRKGTLVLAGVLLPAGAWLAFASGKPPFLFLAVMLGGFSATGSRAAGSVGGAAQPIQTAVIADLTTLGNRTFYFSLFTFLSGLMGAAGMLAAVLFSPRNAFLAAAMASGAGVLFLLPMKLRDQRGEWKRLKSGKVIGKFSLTGAVNGISQGLIMPFLIPFFVIVHHVPKSRMAVYGFASELVAAVAILIAPRIERQFGFVKGVAVTRGLGALLLLLLPLTRILALALVIYLITPALRVIAVPAQQTALTAMVRENEIGRASAMNQVARLTASSGAVAFTGYMFDVSDIALPFYAYAAVIGVSLVLYFRFFGARPELRVE